MVLKLLFQLILALPKALINSFPTFSFVIPDNIFDVLVSMFSSVGYFLPVNELLPILILSLALDVFRVVWAIIIRLKSFIPTMGS